MSHMNVLLADAPDTVHEELAGHQITYFVDPNVLRWIDARLAPGQRTLETGCGHSTIVFAANGTEHTSIAPFASEGDRVREWCASHNVDTSRVTFIVGRSEDVLPRFESEPLDLVLIDGSHSFPHAFIDWYYTARLLRVGGLIVVDDTQIWTGKVLRDSLCETPGWTLVKEWPGTTVAFRKEADADLDVAWNSQPYVKQRSIVLRHDGARAYVELLRDGHVGLAFKRASTVLRRRLGR